MGVIYGHAQYFHCTPFFPFVLEHSGLPEVSCFPKELGHYLICSIRVSAALSPFHMDFKSLPVITCVQLQSSDSRDDRGVIYEHLHVFWDLVIRTSLPQHWISCESGEMCNLYNRLGRRSQDGSLMWRDWYCRNSVSQVTCIIFRSVCNEHKLMRLTFKRSWNLKLIQLYVGLKYYGRGK